MTTELHPCLATASGELVLRGLPAKTLERISRKLSLTNPKYVALQRFHGHTGAEPRRIETAIEMPDGSLHCPRGAVALVREELVKDDFFLKVDTDLRSRGTPITITPRDYLPPRNYQAEGVDKIVKRAQGVIVLPCGTGKTKLGGYAVLALKVTTLVLVHTADLADQWLEDFRAFGVDAGLVGNGRDEHGRDVCVGILDSVLGLLEREPAWGARFGFVILDEAHHAPAATFQRALRLLPALYRVGLTATPDREDGLKNLIDWSFGDVLLERNTREMIKLGYLMAATIEIVSTGFTWSYDGPDKKMLATLEADVSDDLARNALIADRVAADAKRGETCLVLVRNRAHTKMLADMIVSRGVEARALTGRVAKKKRKGAIDDLRAGTLPVVVATSLADEGLDLPRLSAIHLAHPQRARGATIQRLGRLLRLWAKKPRLTDYVDDDVEILASRATARRRVYKDTGLLIEEVTTC